jgi:Papain-like cysteine protease AvrRpt2
MPLRMAEGVPIEIAVRVESRAEAAKAAGIFFGGRRVRARRAKGFRPRKRRLMGRGRLLEVPRDRQRQGEWCWAACVRMVLLYYHGRRAADQCAVVGRRVGRADCCADPSKPECNRPCAPKFMGSVWRSWGLAARSHFRRGRLLGWLDAGALRREIEEGRPVQLGFRWSWGGGHAVVVRGWRETADGRLFFLVNDPWNWTGERRFRGLQDGVSHVSYEELRAGYGMGRWRWTWTGLQPEGDEPWHTPTTSRAPRSPA